MVSAAKQTALRRLPTFSAHRDHILLKLHALDSAIRTGIAVWIVKKYYGLLSVMLMATAAWDSVGDWLGMVILQY